jgi:prepilin-type N-terminal cleavage/methylation domain-containing protein
MAPIPKKEGRKLAGFTLVELLVVISIISLLSSVVLSSLNTTRAKARDTKRIAFTNQVRFAIESYYNDMGYYPMIKDGVGTESVCGSQTDNWGHCDRLNTLATRLAPYIKFDPTQLSNATQGNNYYWYTSYSSGSEGVYAPGQWESYGFMVFLEGNGGANDGGYYSDAYEVGPDPLYCMNKYSGTGRNWTSYQTRCAGGN